MGIAFIVGIVIAAFLLVLLLIKKQKDNSDYILMVWMLLISLHIFLFYLHQYGIDYNYPHLLGILMPVPLLHGVLLYLYTCSLTGIRAIGNIWMHFLPFLILTALAFPFFKLPASEKIFVFQNNGVGYEWYTTIQMTMILVSGFAYSVATIIVIRKHRRQMLDRFSNTDRLTLRWLEYLVYGLTMIWCIVWMVNEVATFGAVVLFVLFIGFFGINQVPIFVGSGIGGFFKDDEEKSGTDQSPRYSKTGLSEESAADLFARVERKMEFDRPYKKADLSLQELASAMNVSANQLSQAINSRTGKSFYHYINTKRLEGFLAQTSHADSKRFTFLALARDCGFSSKTTFNKYFKLHTGKTPSDYFAAGEIQ